jgi:hypothetical protein
MNRCTSPAFRSAVEEDSVGVSLTTAAPFILFRCSAGFAVVTFLCLLTVGAYPENAMAVMK